MNIVVNKDLDLLQVRKIQIKNQSNSVFIQLYIVKIRV